MSCCFACYHMHIVCTCTDIIPNKEAWSKAIPEISINFNCFTVFSPTVNDLLFTCNAVADICINVTSMALQSIELELLCAFFSSTWTLTLKNVSNDTLFYTTKWWCTVTTRPDGQEIDIPIRIDSVKKNWIEWNRIELHQNIRSNRNIELKL